MKKLPFLVALAAAVSLTLVQAADPAPKKLKVLLVAGGCCHDYATQVQLLKNGIESRIHAEVQVEFNPDKGTNATFPIYGSDAWAEPFDVIIHDECSASVSDPIYVKRILQAHANGKPAVNLHCGMHSYRWGNYQKPVAVGADNAGWYEMLGLQSTGHGPKTPIDITFTAKDHPIVKGLADWTTINEELYNNIQILPTATPLASGKQMQKDKEANAVVAWTNLYGEKKTKIFSTTIGHENATVGDERYLDLVTRGLLWATGNLGEDGKATNGFGK